MSRPPSRRLIEHACRPAPSAVERLADTASLPQERLDTCRALIEAGELERAAVELAERAGGARQSLGPGDQQFTGDRRCPPSLERRSAGRGRDARRLPAAAGGGPDDGARRHGIAAADEGRQEPDTLTSPIGSTSPRRSSRRRRAPARDRADIVRNGPGALSPFGSPFPPPRIGAASPVAPLRGRRISALAQVRERRLDRNVRTANRTVPRAASRFLTVRPRDGRQPDGSARGCKSA